MGTVNIKLNGREVPARLGSTVLQAAEDAGVDIPTLCHHPALKDIGACRLCVVEVAGQREVQPACTFPVSDGLVVETETPKVVALRKFILEMLFSERNHYCMYCERSGDCELQALAYRYGLDHFTYAAPHEPMPVDASRAYFLMDHSRCILCRRCVRACDELVGNHTLGLRSRGAKTMVSADMDVPFGESSCVACGTCLQVCPTGALFDRHSAYAGRHSEVARTHTVCSRCSVGCEVEVLTRGQRVLRVEGDWSGRSGGLLCVAGRFESLADPRERVTSPLVRTHRGLEPTSWEEALGAAAGHLRAAGTDVAAFASTRVLNETLDSFVSLFGSRLGAAAAALEPTLSDLSLPADGRLDDIEAADCLLVAGADLGSDHRVAGFRLRRAYDKGSQVLLLGEPGQPRPPFLPRKARIVRLDEAVACCRDSACPVVLVGSGLTREDAEGLAVLGGHARFVLLTPGANGAYAREKGLSDGAVASGARAAYLLLADAPQEPACERLNGTRALVVHASHHGPATERADVVLPAPLWYEREGAFTNADGDLALVRRALPAPDSLLPEAEVLDQLAARL